MKRITCIVAGATIWALALPVAAQDSTGPGPTITLSAGLSIITDHRGGGSVPVSIGLGAKKPGTEFTFIAGRMIVLPGVGVAFGVETGLNVSPWRDGRYGGIVISRIGAAEDAILSLGLRTGVRAPVGRGKRFEARIEVARDTGSDDGGWSVFMAYVSIGYDLGRRVVP